MNLSTLEDLLLSQYIGTAERRFIRLLLELLDGQVSDPLARFTHDIDAGEGPFLDRIGDLLGIARPPVADTNVDFFGFAGEDEGFGRGVLADHITTVGPTVPLDDNSYRRLLRARAITLTSSDGVADVARAARALFDQFGVSTFGRETPFDPPQGPVLGMFAATGHDTRPVLPGAIDRGLILAMSNERDQGANTFRYSRLELNPITGLANNLAHPIEIAGVGQISGMTLWDENDSILLFTHGGTAGAQGTGAYALRVVEWLHETFVLQLNDMGEPMKWEIPLGGGSTSFAADPPISDVTGFGRIGDRHYFVVTEGNPPVSTLYYSSSDPIQGWEPTSSYNSFGGGFPRGRFPRRVYSMVDTPDGLMVGDTQGMQLITALPEPAPGAFGTTDEVTLELQYVSAQGASHEPLAAAHLQGRVVWYDQTSNRVYSDPLVEGRGFTIFGASTDGFYNEAVTNSIDKLVPRPAGVPMRVITEVIENAP